MNNLAMAIGSPPRLVISIDARKNIDTAVTVSSPMEYKIRIYG
jgi:hypothetical protein